MITEFVLQNPFLAGSIAFVFGSVIGSFLNVCAHRIPREQSMIKPGSRCISCGEPIPWTLNLPVFSWLLLRGKAKCCGVRISLRYWVVEVLTGCVFAYCFLHFGANLFPEKAFVAALFASLLIGAAFTDLESFIIPDRFSMGGAVLGVFLAFCFPAIRLGWEMGGTAEHWSSGFDALLGMLVGSASIYWIGALAGKLLRRDALGEGDVKLLGCIGAFCGWQGALFSIFGGAFIGTIVLLPMMLLRGKPDPDEAEAPDAGEAEDDFEPEIEKPSQVGWGIEVPFGPFLAAAALLYHLGLHLPVDAWFDQVRHILVALSAPRA